MSGRRDLGFGATDQIIFAQPKKTPEELELRKKAAETAATDSGFPSREPTTKRNVVSNLIPQRDRRKRTGRDKAFACRTTQDFVERFYRIVDGNEWGVGETFERAINALENELQLKQTK